MKTASHIVAPATDLQQVAAEAAAVAADRRGGRFQARHVLWTISALARVQHCGRYARAGGVSVRVDSSGGARSAGFAGVQTCGSVWACPVCSAKIAGVRQGEIARALTAWTGGTGPQRRTKDRRVALVTLTMRHRKGQALKDLWTGVSDAWQRATGGGAWKADQGVYGVPMSRTIKTGKRAGEVVTEPRIRTIRVVEVTHGESGWHVHVHALLLLGDVQAGDVERVGAGMFARWSASLVASGFDAPTHSAGVDARLLVGDPAAALGEYFTKGVYGAALETARGDLKDARMGNRTPFGILRGLVEVHRTGDLGPTRTPADVARDEAVWAEWELGSKGRRQIAWTPGLRVELLPETPEELTDEEIAEQDQGGDVVAVLDAGTFRCITAHRADWTVLQAFNRSTEHGLAVLRYYATLAGGKVTTGPARSSSPGTLRRCA